MDQFRIAKAKHKAIFNRAFDNYLDLFLICSYIENQNLNPIANSQSFEAFNYNHPNIPQALIAYQATSDKVKFKNGTIKDLDSAIDQWHESNIDLSAYKKSYKGNRIIDLSSFEEFYGPDDFNRQCHYCHIPEEEIKELISRSRIYTKRLSTRGHTMEVDQLEPNKGYQKGNIVLCCYWCNNAKTDEFSAEEFKPVGKVIEGIWKER